MGTEDTCDNPFLTYEQQINKLHNDKNAVDPNYC